MPHFHIDYSANLEERLDIAQLCVVLRDAAVETGTFPLAGIRIRATPALHVVVADGDPSFAFLDISVRLREGRPHEVKQRTVDHLWAAVETFCKPVLDSTPLSLSLEMREIDAHLAPKANSVARYINAERVG